MHIFTYLNKKKHINDFLEKELSVVDALIDVHKKSINKDLINYSNALFVFTNDKEKDSVILN